eukprot:gene12424-26131_t
MPTNNLIKTALLLNKNDNFLEYSCFETIHSSFYPGGSLKAMFAKQILFLSSLSVAYSPKKPKYYGLFRTSSKSIHLKAITDIELDWTLLKNFQSEWPLYEDKNIGNTPKSPHNGPSDCDKVPGEKRLPKSDIKKILKSIDQQFTTLPTLTNISIPSNGHVTVCLPSISNVYIFNGDLVDRGVYSLEILIFLFTIKLCSPDSIHIHRGNHEVEDMNARCGFKDEVLSKYGEEIYELFQTTFNKFPIASVIENKIFVVHGGLGEKLLSLDEIANIDRFTAMGVKGIEENRDVISLL